jgi:tRNA G18 (ribose-2'-O)-methylase SpoU
MEETRNIIDFYHYWDHDAIIADLDSKRNNFTVLCCNLGNDFNIATVIRNANAFLAEKVVIYGNKRYDRRGTVGTHLYTRFQHVKTIDDLEDYIMDLKNNHSNLRVVGFDNISSSVPVETYDWSDDAHTLMIFGEEQKGIPQNVLDKCDDIVYITQYGSVRSLNVGTASGIAMYDYCRKVKCNVS